MISFVIPGNPVPWAAPTFSRRGAYDIKSKKKESIVWMLKSKIKNSSHFPLSCPLEVDFYFEMPIPKSWSKKKKKVFEQNRMNGIKEWHDKKPDRTNCLKLIEDCLQSAGILSNDSVIVSGKTEKYYSPDPKTIVVIKYATSHE